MFLGHGGNDGLVRFASLAKAVSKRFQHRVVMGSNKRSPEHHVPLHSSLATDGAFPAQGASIMRDGVLAL